MGGGGQAGGCYGCTEMDDVDERVARGGTAEGGGQGEKQRHYRQQIRRGVSEVKDIQEVLKWKLAGERRATLQMGQRGRRMRRESLSFDGDA